MVDSIISDRGPVDNGIWNVVVNVRWLIRSDMPEVLKIEQASFEFPWSEEDFFICLRQKRHVAMVAEYGQRIVGFMIYELPKARIHLLSFAVHPDFRNRNVGTQMVRKLVDKLSQQRRKKIVLKVRETNLAAQLFFRSHGFEAVQILHDHYEDTTEDAYVMRYSLDHFTGGPTDAECYGR